MYFCTPDANEAKKHRVQGKRMNQLEKLARVIHFYGPSSMPFILSSHFSKFFFNENEYSSKIYLVDAFLDRQMDEIRVLHSYQAWKGR